jgi:regulator of protease activity HflC (stomatin/prohibitin superfamily)
MNYLITGVILIGLAVVFFKFGIRRTTILEYERGLLYATGKFGKILEPGQYWHSPLFTIIQKTDIRPRFVSITGQELLSTDGITLKVSLAAHYEITDPLSATHKTQNFQESLYLELQLALREIIGAADIDAILKGRNELSSKLLEIAAPKAMEIGLKLISVNLKDIMFPGKLKEVFAQVVSARQEGLAMLEKARGEMAALRSLANAAKMIESNPALLQLRLVQTLSQSSGNTLMLGMPPASPLSTLTQNTASGSKSLGASSEQS